MGTFYPWPKSYLNDCKVPPKFHHRTFPKNMYNTSTEHLYLIWIFDTNTSPNKLFGLAMKLINQYTDLCISSSTVKKKTTISRKKNWYYCLASILSIDDDKCNKNWHPHHDLPQSCGEANPYVQFLYGPQTICNHTWGKFSVSMNADPVN